MPILDLPQLHLPAAGVYLEAVMFWPRDPARHKRLVEAAQNDALRNVLRRRGTDELPAGSLLAVANAAAGERVSDVVNGASRQISQAGVIRREVAGKLFLFALSCAAAGDANEPATLEHARTTLGTAGGKYASYPGLGRSEVIEIWQEFAPAAHLIAAKFATGGNLSNRGPGLAKFLAVAEAFRVLGERHRPTRAKFPLLDAHETWRTPEWLSLPVIADDSPLLPTPAMLREAMVAWPHPRDVRHGADMSTAT